MAYLPFWLYGAFSRHWEPREPGERRSVMRIIAGIAGVLLLVAGLG